jgi:lycopene beta-cyclase
MKHYDYIFTGAGLSALMTVYRMAFSGKFSGKSILLIDENPEKTNDRTWCFWETHGGEFDKIVSHRWDMAWFYDTNFKRLLDLSPYRYKMIRGLDFYQLVFDRIASEDNIEIIHRKVIDFTDSGEHAVVKTTSENFTCGKIFNSIFQPDFALSQKKYPVLQQHFIGWFIKTDKYAFNPKQATFMDFSVAQQENMRFMYVLPVSETEALFEYTLFSKELLAEDQYENAIRKYLEKLNILDYEIVEKERGSIPMTGYKFWKHNSKNILHIGSAGGWTKASTGYTFKNTMKKSTSLIEFLSKETDMRQFHKTNRFWFYDVLLLDILAAKNERGHEIFSALFTFGNPTLILKFLDEETSFAEDLQVIHKCPKSLFLAALSRRIFG